MIEQARVINYRRTIVTFLTAAFISAIYLLCFASRAEAFASVAMSDLYHTILNACEGWLQRAGQIALGLLAVTAVIGFAIGIKDLALSGQITLDSIVALLVRYAFIVGLLVWLLNAPYRLAFITQSIKKIGATISGQDVGFGGILELFCDVVGPLVDFTTGLGWRDIGLIICMTFIIFLINCQFYLIASTVLVVEVEAIFILIGGLFTASFYVIGYFRDLFMCYIKALAAVGVKMLMLSLSLGIMRNIISTWPAMIAAQLDRSESVFSFLMPMACALLGFYMILKAVPQFAASVLSGSVSGMDGGLVKAAAMAGYAMGATVISNSHFAAKNLTGGASNVTQAAQTYQYTAQAAKDTGSTTGQAKAAGAAEAIKTVMTGPQAGGPRGAGERIYADHQRTGQFADVRAGGANANTISAPSRTGAETSPSRGSSVGNVTIAGSYSAASEATSVSKEADSWDSWGSFASDRKKS